MSCIPCTCVCMLSSASLHTRRYCQICTYAAVHICMYLNVFWDYILAYMHLFWGAYLPVSDCISILHTGAYALSMVCMSVCIWLYFLIQYMQILHRFVCFIAPNRPPAGAWKSAVGCAGPSLSCTRAYGTSSKTAHVWGGSCQQGQQPQLQLHNRLLAKKW